MYSYAAYGLGIQSEVALPELDAGESKPGVCIRLANRVPYGVPDTTTQGRFVLNRGSASLQHKHFGHIEVKDGCEIVVTPPPNLNEQLLRFFLLGPALAMVLHQRGILVLHGSGVAINGNAVVFLGEKGKGKSTSAAAMHAAGHPFITDDVVATSITGGDSPLVYPGAPLSKIDPQVMDALGESLEDLLPIEPVPDKKVRLIKRRFVNTALPLKRIYTLDDGAVSGIAHLHHAEALRELMRHSFAARWLASSHPDPFLLDCCIRILRLTPVRRLTKVRSLPALPQLVTMIERDLAT